MICKAKWEASKQASKPSQPAIVSGRCVMSSVKCMYVLYVSKLPFAHGSGLLLPLLDCLSSGARGEGTTKKVAARSLVHIPRAHGNPIGPRFALADALPPAGGTVKKAGLEGRRWRGSEKTRRPQLA